MKNLRVILLITSLLWLLSGVAAIGQTLAQVEAVAKIADVVSQKDLSWLQSFTTALSILFSAWVVKQLINQWSRTTDAILELRDELAKLPCPFRSRDDHRDRG